MNWFKGMRVPKRVWVVLPLLLALLVLPWGARASTATPTGTAQGRDVTDACGTRDLWAGTFYATVSDGGGQAEVYCVDVNTNVCWNKPYEQGSNVDDGRVVWILNNYYPKVPGQPSSLNSAAERAAAVQLAIWHFTDGCSFAEPNWSCGWGGCSTTEKIKSAAWDIINAAQSASTPATPTTLTLTPSSATNYLPGDTFHMVTAELRDQQGNTLQGYIITFTVKRGTQTKATGTAATGANGQASFTYTCTWGEGIDDITAEVSYTIPVGLRWLREGCQKLIMAQQASGKLTATATKTWARDPCAEWATSTLTVNGPIYDYGANTTKFEYTVCVQGKALSHITIQLGACAEIASGTTSGYTLGYDPTTGITGIKWDESGPERSVGGGSGSGGTEDGQL